MGIADICKNALIIALGTVYTSQLALAEQYNAMSFFKRVPMSISDEGRKKLGETSAGDIPVLVRISEAISGFSYDDLAADGSDLVFGEMKDDDSIVVYPHEIEMWNRDGVSLVWVKVPVLSASTKFAMFYGNGVEVENTAKDVWVNYRGVWHLKETDGDAEDATGNGLKAVPTGANKEDSVGVADCAVGFGRQMASEKGRKSYLSVANDDLLDCGNSLTFSGWFKAHNAYANFSMRYVSRKEKYDGSDGWEVEALYVDSADKSATTVSARGASGDNAKTTIPDVRNN